MAITSVVEADYLISKQDPTYTRGILRKRHYSFTKLATDSSVTIATGITGSAKILTVQGSGNVVDKEVSLSFVASTGVITIVSNGTAGPTAGWVDVLYLQQ